MKHCVVLAFLLFGCVGQQSSESPAGLVPGSQAMLFAGFGADTPGGKGGRIIKVTNLNDDGEGSLKAALKTSGARIVVFDVGGVIDWHKDIVNVSAGRLTVAGETAPSPGITVIRGSLVVMAPDLIIRHIRIRLGDGGDPRSPRWQADSMGAFGPDAKNVLIDHCSTSWSIDENLSVSGPRVENGTASFVTIRNSIIAEGLNHSTHSKGPHSKGTLIHDFVHDVALVGNLYAHDYNRNPMLKPNTTAFMGNNLIYDPGSAAIHFAYVPNEYVAIPHAMDPGQLTAVGNVLRMGRFTPPQLAMFACTPGAPFGAGRLYQKDSYVYDRIGQLVWDGVGGSKGHLADPHIQMMDDPMLWPKGFTPLPVALTEAYVLKNAGARPKDRDGVDQRIIREYLERRGGIIDSQDEVGGYPHYRATYRELHVPQDPEKIEGWLSTYLDQVEY